MAPALPASLDDSCISRVLETLSGASSESTACLEASAARSLLQKSHSEAKETMKRALADQKSPKLAALAVQSKILFELGNLSEASASLRNCLLLKPPTSFVSPLRTLLLQSLYLQASEPKIQEARLVAEQIDLSEAPEDLATTTAKIFALSGASKEAKELLVKVPSEAQRTLLGGMLSRVEGDTESARSRFKEVLASDPSNFEALLYLGTLEFSGGARSKSLPHFLKAAKLKPGCPAPFLYLGHLYSESGQLDKARKCYQKSFSLDPDSAEAGAALSDCYTRLGLADSNLALLTSVTERAAAGGHAWAFLRLGMLQMRLGSHTRAVMALQTALRADQDDYVRTHRGFY